MSAKTGYRVVLTPSFTDTSRYSNNSIEFDLVEEKSVEATLEVTTYPTVNGDIIADHIIRQPTTVTINGTFSLEGNKPTVFRGGNDRLTNIEQYFEYLKDTGTLCSITTINKIDNASSRFENRNSMVLENITWTELQNSVKFRFTFMQVMLIDIAQQIIPSYEDENLPAITEPSSLSFAEDILNYDNVTTIVIAILQENGLISSDFLMFVANAGYAITEGIAIGAAVGGVIAAVVGIAVLLASNPVGWAALAIAAVAGAIAIVFQGLANMINTSIAEAKFKVEQFKLYNDDRRNEQEVLRFTNYVSDICNQLLVLDDVINVYSFTTNEAQKCTVYLGNNYYKFIVNKNNSTGKWMLDVYDIKDNCLAANVNIADKAIESIDECKPSTELFLVPGTGAEIYLINLAASRNNDWYQDNVNDLEKLPAEPVIEDIQDELRKEHPDWDETKIADEAIVLYAIRLAEWKIEYDAITKRNNQKIEDAREEAIRQGTKDLTNYAILECRTEMASFNEKLKDIIYNAMTR